MAKWRSYFKHAVNVHLACRGRHSEALPALVTIALAFGAKRLAKVMHLYENFRRWKHLAQLLISALIKQVR
jgi:hypothetical protein